MTQCDGGSEKIVSLRYQDAPDFEENIDNMAQFLKNTLLVWRNPGMVIRKTN